MDSFFDWDSSRFALGVPDMDREHQGIVRLMNSLHRLHQAGAGAPVVAKALAEFLRYTAEHFVDEEAYMRAIHYPDLPAHAAEHAQLTTRVNVFREEFLAKGRLGDDFFQFLKTWLKAHICDVDARYAAFTRNAA